LTRLGGCHVASATGWRRGGCWAGEAHGGDLKSLAGRYAASLRAGGRSEGHVGRTELAIQLRLEPLIAWLAGRRAMDGKTIEVASTRGHSRPVRFGTRTSNAYLMAMCSFARWLTVEGHLERNPLVRAKPLRQDVKRVTRRALLPAEVGKLLKVAGPVFGVPAADRVMLYRMALETGLRSGELRSLTVGSSAFLGLALNPFSGKTYTKTHCAYIISIDTYTISIIFPPHAQCSCFRSTGEGREVLRRDRRRGRARGRRPPYAGERNRGHVSPVVAVC